MTVSSVIDLTKYVCPLTYALLKAHLEELAPGDTIEVDLQGQNTLSDVTKMLKIDGYMVVKVYPKEAVVYRLTITR